MTSQPRPVWIDDEEALTLLELKDIAYRHHVAGYALLVRITNDRERAPADAAEAAAKAVCPKADWAWERYPEAYRNWWRDRSDEVLRALGHPHTEQA